jgi:hypothetical protein
MLQSTSPKAALKFVPRLSASPEGARAETAAYHAFKKMVRSIDVYEHPDLGGPDFICRTEQGDFLLEVTSMTVAAVERQSQIPNELVTGSGSYSPVGTGIYAKAVSKVGQLSGRGLPAVLAIATEHNFGFILLESRAATHLLMGTPLIAFSVDEPQKPMTQTTNFEDSVFYAMDNEGTIEHLRPDISAVILIQIHPDMARLVGALNPMPSIAYKPGMTPLVPFADTIEKLSEHSLSISVVWRNGSTPVDISF